MAMGLRIAHPGGLLKGHQVEAFAAQPGGLHADAVFDVHRVDIMGVDVELHKVGQIPHLDRAHLVVTAEDEGRIERLGAQRLPMRR